MGAAALRALFSSGRGAATLRALFSSGRGTVGARLRFFIAGGRRAERRGVAGPLSLTHTLSLSPRDSNNQVVQRPNDRSSESTDVRGSTGARNYN